MKKKISNGILYFILICLSLIFLFPFFWALVTALKSPAEIFAYPPSFFPKELHFANFAEAWTAQPFTKYLINSLIVTFFAVVGMTFSSALTAYGFARFEFPGKNLLFMILLSTMMIPWEVLVIPLYMQYNFFGWLDTLKPLIIPSFFGGAFYIFLMKQFLRTIPKDFEESAIIDGANYWQIFCKIFLPLLKPQMVLSAVMYMIIVWNDYLGPLVYISNSEKFTLPIGLSLYKGAHTTNFSAIMAITVIMTVPTVVAFFIGQKHILGSNISSGIKG